MANSSNPVFRRSDEFTNRGTAQYVPTPDAAQLDEMYNAPAATAADTGRMTYDDVVVKTGLTFAVLVAGAVVGWQMPQFFFPAMIIGFALGLVNSFKRNPSPALILVYAAFQGVFVGGISMLFQNVGIGGEPLDGIVSQAIFGTLVVVGVTLALYRSGKIRVTPKFRKMVLIAGVSYLAFALLNLGAMLLGFTDGPFGFRGGLIGIGISVFAIGLAAMFLVLDFDFIEKGVKAGIPRKFAWTAAFGLTVTVVWIYVEMLRLLAILQSD